MWGVKGRNHTILGKTALCKLLMEKNMVETTTLQGCYSAKSDNSTLMCQDNLLFYSPRVKKSKKSLVLKTNCESQEELR
jgi:hypothetical protein